MSYNESEGIMSLLFPTPVLTFTLNNHVKNKEKHLSTLINYYQFNKEKKARWSRLDNTCTWFEHGISFFDDQFKERIEYYISYLLQKEFKSSYRFQPWFNLHTSNSYMREHGHNGSIISGIYYFQFNNKTDNPVSFVNPLKYELESWVAMNNWEIEPNNKFLVEDTTSRIDLHIKEGSVVLFPSYLKHFVPEGLEATDDLRITYTFNVILDNLTKRIVEQEQTYGYINMNYSENEPRINS